MRLAIGLAICACAIACKGNDRGNSRQGSAQPDHPAAMGDAGARIDCAAALTAAAAAAPAHRAKTLIEGCKPCGDWAPLLGWNKLSTDGGPSRTAIESTMLACNAYCNVNAKMRFLGALDRKRGEDSRLPWRILGDQCERQVSAVPDSRYMSAPYFALDRIARYVAAGPGAAQLAGLEIPLPAVSISGAGLELPESTATRPTASAGGITVTMSEVRAGKLPIAKLSVDGVTVTGDAYPGEVIAERDLQAALDKLGNPITLFAPRGMKAARLAALATAAGARTFVMATQLSDSLAGWPMYGTVPTALTGKIDPSGLALTLDASADPAIERVRTAQPAALTAPPTITIRPDATVDGLAKLLGALATKNVPAAAIVAAGERP
ncbi:MAG: hypothetical protein AB7P03_18625 [Kofleriaceae bacterium]